MARPSPRNFASPAALACFILTAAVGLGLDLWTKKVAFAKLAPAGVEWRETGDPNLGPRVAVQPVRQFHVGPVKPDASAQEKAEAVLGLQLTTLTEDSPRRALLSGNPGTGALVSNVQPNSLAQHSGLANGDLITSVNGLPVRSAQEAGDAIAKMIAAVNADPRANPHEMDLQIVTRSGTQGVTVLPDDEMKVERFLPRWLHFQAMANQGAVFGLGQGRRLLFLGVSVAAIAFIVYLFATSGRQRFYQFILGLLLAGVLGNMYDRLALGYVRDMIYIFPGRIVAGREVFPWIFNVADSLLCVGVALIFLYSLRGAPKKKEEPEAEQPESGVARADAAR